MIYIKTIDGNDELPVVSKELVHDLIPDLQSFGGYVVDKVEGLAIMEDGTTWVSTDNDGVDDSSGETFFLVYRKISDVSKSVRKMSSSVYAPKMYYNNYTFYLKDCNIISCAVAFAAVWKQLTLFKPAYPPFESAYNPALFKRMVFCVVFLGKRKTKRIN